MRTVNIEEAKLPSELLNTIANGELILITQQENPVAILSPVTITPSALANSQIASNTQPETPKKQLRLDTAKGSIWMSEDFNEPLDDMTGILMKN